MIETFDIECPHCQKKLKLHTAVSWNVHGYNDTVTARTECCGKPVQVSAVRRIKVSGISTTKTEDDWGRKFKR